MLKRAASTGVDIALCFVPQWTPFQPALSLPSLAAWVRRANFSADVFDANIAFYNFLLSERCASILLAQDLPEPRNRVGKERREAALKAVAAWQTYRDDVDRLLRWGPVPHEVCRQERASVLADTCKAIGSLETYLGHVSALSPRFVIGLYGFRSRLPSAKGRDVENFVESPPELLREFSSMVAECLLRPVPRMVGLSCVGFSQTVFTLLIGRAIKQRADVPIIVGGSTFPRVIERGAMPIAWFGRYIDVVVRDEGEKPLEALLRAASLEPVSLQQIPGIAFADGDKVISTPAPPLLRPGEVPAPDYAGMPLASYVSGKVVLPIMASKGCYWGKCAFCHVAVETYSSPTATDVVSTLQMLREKHGAAYFAFHDEAIPPALFRRLGSELPHDQSIFLAGLIKFEKYYQPEDFAHAYGAGFRLLSIGLESASDRVLTLMDKNNPRSVMLSNLTDGTVANIWMRCFVMFGFPGEQPADAEETIDFIIQQRDVIGSFAAGWFRLNPQAPIMRRLKEYGVTALPGDTDDVEIYYDHEVADGINIHEAKGFVQRLNEFCSRDRKYGPHAWISQQHLLVLLSLYSPGELVEACAKLLDDPNAPTLQSESSIALHA